MSATLSTEFTYVYGPVKSWRYGRSLGIDPIGAVSTCSFNCVYCQLGEIEQITRDRALFVPTEKIIQELQEFAPWDVDVITLSGSGEPTLASNLGEIITSIAQLTSRPTLVLTNATLLKDKTVRQELAIADKVSVKIDAVSPRRWQGVDRPATGVNFADVWEGISEFRAEYSGELGIQTMMLSNWDAEDIAEYIRRVRAIGPTEIQLNTPTRPKPLKRQLDGRGNHSSTEERPYAVQQLKCVSAEILQKFAQKIQNATGIPVRFPPQ